MKVFISRHIAAFFLLLLSVHIGAQAPGTHDRISRGTRQRPTAIVVGASSGMGRELAKILARDYNVGLVARRIDRLKVLQEEIFQKDPACLTWVKHLDVTDADAMEQLVSFINEIGGLDLMVISITSFPDLHDKTDLEAEKLTLEVELLGFWKMAYVATQFFMQQGSGHLVGISSVDALRGNPACPIYSAAKAFVSSYLEGTRNRLHNKKFDSIFVTDILPGYVQTEGFDAEHVKGAYWIATARDAALQIYDAIAAHQKQAYITRRWWLIGMLMHHLPDWLFYDIIGGL